MSGRKQHFIPQMLLRQFATDDARKIKSVQVWVLPKSGDPYRSATEGVAAQRHFYSELSEEVTLDDIITQYEDRFGSLLEILTDTTSNSEASADVAKEFVSHLVMRNANLRDGLERTMRGVFDVAVDTFGDAKKMRAHIGLDALRPGKNFDKYFADKAEQLPDEIRGYPPGLVRLMAFSAARENIDTVLKSSVDIMVEAIAQVSGTLKKETRDVHNRILENSPVSTGFVDASGISNWLVMESEERLVLADCVAVGINEQGSASPLIFTSGKTLSQIFLPLSKHKVLVGRRPGYGWPEIERFNEMSARCSDRFFVASECSDQTTALVQNMGENLSSTIQSLLDEAAKVLGPSATEIDSPDYGFQLRPDDDGAPKLETYPVVFSDFSADDPLQRIADDIGVVVREAKDIISLERLAGFTFAHNYEQALLDLDRGFHASEPLTTISPEFGRGLFRTPMVVRDGHPKFQVVARAEMAFGIIDAQKDVQDFYLYGLLRALANVGYSGLMEESMPGILAGRFHDNMEAERFNAVDSALTCYFSCRVAASVYPTVISDHVTLLLDTVRVTEGRIRSQVEAHWRNADFAMMGQSSMYHSSLILDRLAEIAGTLASLSKSHREYPDFVHFLQKSKLENWFVTFCADLDHWWKRQGNWKGLDDFMPYVMHFDRMTWALRLPLWRDEEKGWQVFVPSPPLDFSADEVAPEM